MNVGGERLYSFNISVAMVANDTVDDSTTPSTSRWASNAWRCQGNARTLSVRKQSHQANSCLLPGKQVVSEVREWF